MLLENEGYYISVASHEEFTRDDIVVDYLPGEGVVNYSYTVIKNGEQSETVYVEDATAQRIVLNETGQYRIEFVNYNTDETTTTFETGIYNIDKEAPKIEISKDSFKIEAGSTLNVLEGVRATDRQDGNLTTKITTNADTIDFDSLGKKEVTYSVTDSAGNTATQTVTFEVVESHRAEVFLTECVIIGTICVILFLIARYYRTMMLERRLGKYTLEPDGRTNNFFDRIVAMKNGMVQTLSKRLQKYTWMEYYSSRYEKYQIAFRESSTVDIVAKKILMSMLFLVFALVSATLKLEVLSFLEMLLALLLGYVLVDVIYWVRYHFYRNHIENDLLQAIIVMNNAFRSGHSIPQAVELVAEELEGDIHIEFLKMHRELSVGLSVEEVFGRFASRVGIDEVNYLTSSLSILNQTGGNIVKVFASIEKTLMNKKKLRLELKALTSSAKLVSYVLMLLPALFVAGISFVSPDYFLPLVSSPIGLLMLLVIILIYFVYIYIIRQVMKVRM